MRMCRSAYFFWYLIIGVTSLRCDRKPYGTMTQASAADGRYTLTVVDTENTRTYLPEHLYTVKLSETDGESTFIAFMVTAEGDMKKNPDNPRKMISLYPGELRPQDEETTKFSERCPYSLEQTMYSLKSSIEIYWLAPKSGNGCVILRAMVAENENVWFADGSPLTYKICEDVSQPDDMAPQVNYECQICDEAKYEFTFTGMWSRHTHPRLYPENDWIPHYSDLVGASHSADTILWAPGTLASPGLQTLAEHANTSAFETEIREKIDNGVRTLIKGKGHGYRKMHVPTYAFFRADKTHHMVTAAVGLYPSPDWFLGVARFELCQADNTWLLERKLNLYPWDAGTDSGVNYEASNIQTYPQDAIARVQMSSYDKNSPFFETDMKTLHPFGTFNIKLVRTFQRDCEGPTEVSTTEANKVEGGESGENNGTETKSDIEDQTVKNKPKRKEEEPSSTESPIIADPLATVECPLSQWQEWSPCEGSCEKGKLAGLRWRERYHLVDGIAIEKYDPNIDLSSVTKEVPKYCKSHFSDFEKEDCDEPCTDEDDIKAEQQTNDKPISPGTAWTSKKRNAA